MCHSKKRKAENVRFLEIFTVPIGGGCIRNVTVGIFNCWLSTFRKMSAPP